MPSFSHVIKKKIKIKKIGEIADVIDPDGELRNCFD